MSPTNHLWDNVDCEYPRISHYSAEMRGGRTDIDQSTNRPSADLRCSSPKRACLVRLGFRRLRNPRTPTVRGAESLLHAQTASDLLKPSVGHKNTTALSTNQGIEVGAVRSSREHPFRFEKRVPNAYSYRMPIAVDSADGRALD